MHVDPYVDFKGPVNKNMYISLYVDDMIIAKVKLQRHK